MAFFLIVPSVMIVSVMLVHKLANRLGLKIYYTTLVAVAVLSFMVDFAAVMITPAVGREFLLRLGIIILAASFLVTMANRFLIKQQHTEEKNFDEEVKAAYESEKEVLPSPFSDFQWEEEAPTSKYNESISAEPVKEVAEPAQKVEPVKAVAEPAKDAEHVKAVTEPAKDAEHVKAVTEPAEDAEPVKAVTEPAEDAEPVKAVAEPAKDAEHVKAVAEPAKDAEHVKAVAKPVEAFKSPKEFPLEKVFEPLADVKPEELEKINDAEYKPEPEPEFPLEEVFQPLAEVKQEEVKVPKENPKPEDKFPLQEVFKPLSMLKLEKLDQLPAEEITPSPEESEEEETLDDILDRAYNERDKGHIWQAIEFYKKALERYRNDEYAPFVAIDLGNIYKEQALYAKAIKTFEEALTLPAITRNENIKKEFTTNLDYLRVLRDVLLKYHALSVPFAKLSPEILQEIDTEFQKAQRHSEQFK